MQIIIISDSFDVSRITMTEMKGRPGNEPGADKHRQLCSEALFAGATTVVIQHQGAEYKLQVTRQGKLILTK